VNSRLILGIIAAVLLITGLAVAGYLVQERAGVPTTPAAPERANWPEVLRVGVGWGEAKEELKARWGPLAEYLEKELGIQVELFTGADYTAVIEAMRAGRIQLAKYGPFGYILAAQRANAEAIATTGIVTEEHPEGTPATYHSYIITHPGTGLQSLDDVKRRSRELTFSFVDPASTSGYLIPKGHLLSIGIDPDTDFSRIIFAGSHAKSVLAVKAGKVDVGANMLIEDMIEQGKIAPEEVVILWKSPPLPMSPFAVRGDIDPELRRRIQQALVDMHKNDPEALVASTGGREDLILVPIDDSHYDFFRPLARALGYIE